MRSLPGARSMVVLCVALAGPALISLVALPRAAVAIGQAAVAAPVVAAAQVSPAASAGVRSPSGIGLPLGGAAAQAPVEGRADSGAQPHPVDPEVTRLALTASSGLRSAGASVGGGPAVLTKARRTESFQTLGVTWAQTGSGEVPPGLVVSVRTHNAKGWSAWTDLDADAGDDDADGAEAARSGVRAGTEPLWVGPSDGVQTRVVLKSGRLPKDLKVELVDPGTSDYDAAAARTTPGAIASAPTTPAPTTPAPTTAGTPATAPGLASATVSAAGMTGVAEPLILSRATWGANESKVRYAPTYMPTIKAGVLHHTAGPNNYRPAQVPAIIRGDYAYHLSRGWSDIGYNALVDRFGRIWEGRAGGLQYAVMGAHAGGFNSDTFGVSMIGNYDTARPSAASISAVVRFMAWKLDLNHRNPFGSTKLTSAGGGTSRYAAGRTVTFPVIMGHRNTGRTDCPGRHLYPYLPSIRTRVAALMKAALLDPAGPQASLPRGAPLTVTATALAAQSWRLDVTAPCGAGRVARISGTAAARKRFAATWNGLLADGTAARPGRYTLTLTSTAKPKGTAKTVAVQARPVVYSVLVVPPAAIPVPSGTPSAGAGGYVPLTPVRLLDTSAADNVGVGPAGRVDVPVLGRAGVPTSGVTAVVLNLTATCVSDDTSLTVWPSGTPASSRAVTALRAGGTDSILVTARVGADGAVSIGNAHGVVELTADVIGYYGPAGAPLQAVPGTRVYDSRLDPAGPLLPGQPRLITLPQTLAGVATSQVRAVVIDVSALGATAVGSLTAYRPGAAGDLPGLRYGKGATVDNLAIVEVSGGTILLRADGAPGASVNALLEVRGLVLDPTAVVPTVSPTPTTPGSTAPGSTAPGSTATPAPTPSTSPTSPGGLAGAAFTAIKPRLILDTRTTGGAVTSAKPRQLLITGTGAGTGVPATARAVLVDVTGLAPSTSTWLQVYPAATTPQEGAAVRVPAGRTRGNLVLVPIGTNGAITISNARGSSQVRIDVQGYLG